LVCSHGAHSGVSDSAFASARFAGASRSAHYSELTVALPRLPPPSLFCSRSSSASGDVVRGLHIRARCRPVVTWHVWVGGWQRHAWWRVILGPAVLRQPTSSTEGGAHGVQWCGGDGCCCKRMKSTLISFLSGASISESSLSVQRVRNGRSCAIFGLDVESNC
jgi:hypothetical protein